MRLDRNYSKSTIGYKHGSWHERDGDDHHDGLLKGEVGEGGACHLLGQAKSGQRHQHRFFLLDQRYATDHGNDED